MRGAEYRPDSQGTRQFMNSKMIGDAMGKVAADFRAQLREQGAKSSYEARQRTVTGGRNASNRAGAEIVETDRYWGDVKRRRLVNLSRQYRMRGGG